MNKQLYIILVLALTLLSCNNQNNKTAIDFNNTLEQNKEFTHNIYNYIKSNDIAKLESNKFTIEEFEEYFEPLGSVYDLLVKNYKSDFYSYDLKRQLRNLTERIESRKITLSDINKDEVRIKIYSFKENTEFISSIQLDHQTNLVVHSRFVNDSIFKFSKITYSTYFE